MRADAVRPRQRIIEVASQEISRLGKNFTLEDVAAKAEIGTATLYRNFPTRNELVASCILYLCDEVSEKLDAVIERVHIKSELWPRGRSGAWLLRSPCRRQLVGSYSDQPSGGSATCQLLEKNRQFVTSLEAVIKVARAKDYIHHTVRDNWLING